MNRSELRDLDNKDFEANINQNVLRIVFLFGDRTVVQCPIVMDRVM